MTRRFIYVNLACALFFACAPSADASMLSFVRDLISTSAPTTGASHAIEFTVAQAIPASGRIVVVPEGAFSFPVGFNVSDVSLLVSTGGPYAPRTLASAQSATEDGVTIVSGSSPSISFTLNTTDDIPAGSAVRVALASTSTDAPVNADTLGSYRIRINTFLGNGATLDYGTAMVAIVAPVSASVGIVQHEPLRTNGEPSGTIAAGSSIIELSLTTDELATCRYATTTGVVYGSMTHAFTPSIGSVFYTDLTGFQNNTSYSFYVRCISTQGLANTNDYPISFTLSPTPASNTSSASSDSSSSGNNNGTGQYPFGSQVLYLGSVELSGFTSPGASVTVLQDGSVAAVTSADSSGRFDTTVPNLERGLYTFSVYATDSRGVKTSADSETLTVNQGSANLISSILLPPSVAVTSNTVAVGDDITVSGATSPGAKVEVSAVGNPLLLTATSSSAGSWSVVIPGKTLSKGSYQISARTIKSADSISNYSTPLKLTVGAGAVGACNSSSDLNGDGKVNLIDFSIFLTNWGGGPQGDFNCDGNVNLADFSIMLFNWTG
ncbi:MAG: Dockerin type domain [Candidatus Parcubacteria bacterium]|jgi:hypothetical protein